ncbi:hypothetical protein FF1_042549 [Malus domestica]
MFEEDEEEEKRDLGVGRAGAVLTCFILVLGGAQWFLLPLVKLLGCGGPPHLNDTYQQQTPPTVCLISRIHSHCLIAAR